MALIVLCLNLVQVRLALTLLPLISYKYLIVISVLHDNIYIVNTELLCDLRILSGGISSH